MRLFFRNDDLGWDLAKFSRLLEIFVTTGHRLNAASIPLASLEAYPRNAFSEFADHLEVHAHGLAHLDHETSGKKCEFGGTRDAQAVRRDLQQSLNLTQETFPQLFFPAFTPPWNRIDDAFIPLLAEVGFKVLSRDLNKRSSVPGLKDINVDLDLHTNRKGINWLPEKIWTETQRLLETQDTVGIMLHHKHMNEDDYTRLKEFLTLLNQNRIRSHFLKELV